MNPLRSMAILLLLAGISLAGETQHDQVIRGMLSAMDKLNKTLGTVRDENSAQAAKKDLRKAADEWLALRKKADNVPPPSKAESDRLVREYRGKLEEAQKRLFGQIVRVQMIPGGKEALGDIPRIFAPERKTKS